jgi:hypothetical protein
VVDEVDQGAPCDAGSEAAGVVLLSDGDGVVDDGDSDGVGGAEDGADDGASEGDSVGESVGVGSSDGSGGSTSSRSGIEVLPSASGRSTNRHR